MSLKRLESSSDKTNFARVAEDFPVEKRPFTQVHTEAAVGGAGGGTNKYMG